MSHKDSKPKYEQAPHSVGELLPLAEVAFNDPILATLVESGLAPSVLDRYCKEILGWPNELCRSLRDAAYLRDQHPKEWQKRTQIEVKDSETKVITPLSGGTIPLFQRCIDQSRRLCNLFAFAPDKRLSGITIDGQNGQLLMATHVKVGNRQGKLTHPLLLCPFAVQAGAKLVTTIDGEGVPYIWHGHQDDAYGLWRFLTFQCDGKKDCGSLEYIPNSGWNWHTNGSNDLMTGGILLMFDSLIEDRDIDYGRHGYSDCLKHKVPRFAYKVILRQHVPARDGRLAAVNKVTYRGYIDNHPSKGCTDGVVVYERYIPFGDQSTEDPKCLVVQVTYEDICCQCADWQPSLYDVDGFHPCIRIDRAEKKLRHQTDCAEDVALREASGILAAIAGANTSTTVKAFSGSSASFDINAVFGEGLLKNPDRDLVEIFT